MSKAQASKTNSTKAVVLDFDGVVVGNMQGINFPNPSVNVKKALLKVYNSGIPVSFLTARSTFIVADNIKYVGLNNAHIADGGSTLFNPITGETIEAKPMSPDVVKRIIDTFPPDTYINIFGSSDYYLQDGLQGAITDAYDKIGGRGPKLVDDLSSIIGKVDIFKINIVAVNSEQKVSFTKLTDGLTDQISRAWSINPTTPGIDYLVITGLGVSKKSGVLSLSKHLGVSLDDILAVGDTMHDWEFIQMCGYRAAMGNASNELKSKIDVADTEHQVIGGHVNDDGLVKVFEHFKLL